jgi:protein phosphatase
MLEREPVYVAVLTVLSILVVVLVAVVVVLARSLRANKDGDKRGRPSPLEATPSDRSKATSKTRRALSATPKEAEPSIVTPKEAEPIVVTPAEIDGGADVEPSAPIGPVKDIPSLSMGSDEAPESSGSSDLSIARLQFDSDAQIDLDEPTGAVELILVSAIGQTDRGVARRRNEDAYLIDTNLQLFAVADGMGGHAGGDVASRLAIQEVWNAMQSPQQVREGYEDCPPHGRELIAAVERANETIFQQSRTISTLNGMGSTLVAASFAARKQRLYIAHVGDSRCYRYRAGELRTLTVDHTLASRGVEGPLGQNISRAVGIAKKVKVDLIVDKPIPDDLFLLCSDGLPKMVTDQHIRKILDTHANSLDRAAAQLVLAANASGGRDNITVVLVRILEITKTMRTAALIKSQKRVEFGPS